MIRSLSEDFKNLPLTKHSKAHEQAVQLGLDSYGFGRYGKDGKLTHIVSKTGKLIPFKTMSLNDKASYMSIKDYEDAKKDYAAANRGIPESEKKYYAYGIEKETKDPEGYQNILKAGKEWQKVVGDYAETKKQADEFIRNLEQEAKATAKILNQLDEYDWNYLNRTEQKHLDEFNAGSYSNIQKLALQLSKTSGLGPNTGRDQKMSDTGEVMVDESYWNIYKDNLKTMDKLTRERKLPMDITTYAGVATFLQKSNIGVGSRYLNPAFRSTSLNPRVAESFSGIGQKGKSKNPRTIIQFDLKKGQPGFYLQGKNNVSLYDNEYEFLLPRKSVIKIVDEKKMWSLDSDEPLHVYIAELEEVQDADADAEFNDAKESNRTFKPKNEFEA